MLITGAGDGGTSSTTTGGVGSSGSGMVVNMQYVQSEQMLSLTALICQ
jgi:hypothetical protein